MMKKNRPHLHSAKVPILGEGGVQKIGNGFRLGGGAFSRLGPINVFLCVYVQFCKLIRANYAESVVCVAGLSPISPTNTQKETLFKAYLYKSLRIPLRILVKYNELKSKHWDNTRLITEYYNSGPKTLAIVINRTCVRNKGLLPINQ